MQNDHQKLAALIAESLDLADLLGLNRVAISLNDALEQLGGSASPAQH